MPAHNGATLRSPERLAANQPMARALRIARAGRTQPEFIAALRAAGVPVGGQNQYSGWELGADLDAVNPRNVTIVPAYVLVGASKVSGRPIGELLTAAGVEGQDPYADRVAALERRIAELEGRLEGWEIELAAQAGRDPGEALPGDPISLDMVALRRRVEELFSVLEELRNQQA